MADTPRTLKGPRGRSPKGEFDGGLSEGRRGKVPEGLQYYKTLSRAHSAHTHGACDSTSTDDACLCETRCAYDAFVIVVVSVDIIVVIGMVGGGIVAFVYIIVVIILVVVFVCVFDGPDRARARACF